MFRLGIKPRGIPFPFQDKHVILNRSDPFKLTKNQNDSSPTHAVHSRYEQYTSRMIAFCVVLWFRDCFYRSKLLFSKLFKTESHCRFNTKFDLKNIKSWDFSKKKTSREYCREDTHEVSFQLDDDDCPYLECP